EGGRRRPGRDRARQEEAGRGRQRRPRRAEPLAVDRQEVAVATVTATAARSGRSRLRRAEWPWVLLFLGPNLVLFLIFTVFPVFYGFFLSFQKWNVIEPMQFIGLANYQRFFFEDKLAGKVVLNTIYYAVAAMPAQIALA